LNNDGKINFEELATIASYPIPEDADETPNAAFVAVVIFVATGIEPTADTASPLKFVGYAFEKPVNVCE
jgi:hypothetical protein